MFTGIVEQLGTVVEVVPCADSAQLAVRGGFVTADAHEGDSIAVNGVCLTVVRAENDIFVTDVMGETLRCSSLGGLVVGDRVNLERAATVTTRLGGHLVQGHVDGVGVVLRRQPEQNWETVWFTLPSELNRYVVTKGSIAVDGVSLTVVEVDDTSFSVGLIPTTLAATTLGQAEVGAVVNLEVDIMAKYVEKLLRGQGSS